MLATPKNRLRLSTRPAAVCLVACVALSSCAVQSRTASPQATGDESLDHGVFQPMSIRIHPLTREVQPSPQDDAARTIVIDVHVELFDAWGHPTKALGTLQFELVQGSRTGLAAANSLEANVSRATIDMLDPEINSVQFYDSATRTYRMYLEAPRRATNAPITISAVYVSPSGRRLEDRYIIDRRAMPAPPTNLVPDTQTQESSSPDASP